MITPPEDNIESIFDTAKKLARTYSYGGGCGVDISKLSPKGATIHNAAKETSGSVSFMDLYSTVTGLIGQSGRRGALMISIDCNHPDVIEFVKVKTDLDKVTKANISVKINDKFMEAVKENKDWTLSFVREETGQEITNTIKARDLFYLMAKTNWDYAEPGMLFWDTIKNWNLLANTKDFEFAGTNPCVTGDTLILTMDGYKPIEDICDKQTMIWNGYKWSSVLPHVTGHNQQMKKVSFSDGSEITCTDYHKFILSDESRKIADDLNIGEKIIKCNFPLIDSGEKIRDNLAYTQGFFMGDGFTTAGRKRMGIYLYGAKKKLLPYLLYKEVNKYNSSDRLVLSLDYDTDHYNKHFVPSVNYSIADRLEWLAGYIDSDGTQQGKDGGISISSTNKDILIKVKYMLNTITLHFCGCKRSLHIE